MRLCAGLAGAQRLATTPEYQGKPVATPRPLSYIAGVLAKGFRLMLRSIMVRAVWDNEAQGWVAISEDIPGLVTGADTIAAG